MEGMLPWMAAENCGTDIDCPPCNDAPAPAAVTVPFGCNNVLYDERGTKALVPSMVFVWNDVEKNNGAPPQTIMDKAFSTETRRAFCEHVRGISVAPFYGFDWSNNGRACSKCATANDNRTSLAATLRCMGWT